MSIRLFGCVVVVMASAVTVGSLSRESTAAPCAGAPTNVTCDNNCATDPIEDTYCEAAHPTNEFSAGQGSGCEMKHTGNTRQQFNPATQQMETQYEYKCVDDASASCNGDQFQTPVEGQCLPVDPQGPYAGNKCQVDVQVAILVLKKTNKSCSGPIAVWSFVPPAQFEGYYSNCGCEGEEDQDDPESCEWTVCNCTNC